ncbi:hypothetical protein Tco_0085420 [Tanacetum coccineum]
MKELTTIEVEENMRHTISFRMVFVNKSETVLFETSRESLILWQNRRYISPPGTKRRYRYVVRSLNADEEEKFQRLRQPPTPSSAPPDPPPEATSHIPNCDILPRDDPLLDLCEKVWILLLELVFTFPCKLRTSLGVPSNLDNWNAASLFNIQKMVQYTFKGMLIVTYLPSHALLFDYDEKGKISQCACSRFQVQLKASHMHAVKRIFRYLKGQPTLGLWYPKDSPMDLIAYSDSDYAGASIDRKSTTGGSEYIAASNYYGQVLWLQNQLLDYGYNFMKTQIHLDNESAICVVKNQVYHSKNKHIEIRHHFIRDSYEKKLIEMVKIHTNYNVLDLLTKAFNVTRFQFLIASIGLEDDIPPPPPPPQTQTPTQQAPHTVLTIKLLILKKGEYNIWAMKMEHYLAYTNYPIWEVIQRGNGHVSVLTDTNDVIKVLPPKTAEEILARERERKARTTLLMALPEDHLAKFHKMTDAKEMWEAIKSRFSGNDES